MLSVNDLSMQFGSSVLFSHVDLGIPPRQLLRHHRRERRGQIHLYKDTFRRAGTDRRRVMLDAKQRMSGPQAEPEPVRRLPVLDTVIIGNQRLYDCGKEKDAIYEKQDFTDEDGIRAAELEEEFAELGGWEAETDAGRILQGLGVDVSASPEPHARR